MGDWGFVVTETGFGIFAVCLEYLPYGTAPAWDKGCARFYFAVLSDIPDAAVPVLMKAVGTQFTFRPTPHDILAIYAKLTAPADALTPASLVAKLAERVRRHGACGMPHPTLRNCFLPGPPPDLTDAEASVVATWGGWGPYCEDDSPAGVRRGQLLKVADMVLQGGQGEGLRRLRLEYQALQSALPATTPELDDTRFETLPAGHVSAQGSTGLTRLDLLRFQRK